MDRIRNAIARARDGSAEQSPHAAEPAPLKTVGVAPTQAGKFNYLDFPEVDCETRNFNRYRIISNEQDPVLNSFRVLRTRVLQKMKANNWRSIAVVSPGSGAGKTVTAINLSIALGSKAGVRPTLVDLDFYRPSVARYLGLSEHPSVLDYFEGSRSLEQVTVRPNLPEMLLMPNERVTRRGAEYLNSKRTDDLINTVTGSFGSQLVIFDLSPLLGCDDAIAFLPHVDCALLIAASGQTRAAEVKEAKRILGKTNLLGTVLNKSPRSMLPNPYY